MKQVVRALICCVLALAPQCHAQELKRLNFQAHGFATQGLLYTTHNNLFTTNSSKVSPAWTEAVLNVSAQPLAKLTVAAQGRFFRLGEYGNAVTMDWAQADYRFNDRLGLRVGKVKTPIGLLNETQDVDPSYLWALLPQSLYTITSRNSILAHTGGVIYGSLQLGDRFGKLQYRAWGGQGSYGPDDGYFRQQSEAGYDLPDGIEGAEYGGALRWQTPLRGLLIGVSEHHVKPWKAALTGQNGVAWGWETISANTQPSYFAQYEKNKMMIAYEYSRSWQDVTFHLLDDGYSPGRNDDRGWYAMASYKVSSRLTAGVYESENSDHQASLGPSRYQRDLALAGRYDVTPYIYVKAEQHILRGTGLNYDANHNPELRPNTELSVLKVGVSF